MQFHFQNQSKNLSHKIQYNSKYVLDEETGTLTIFDAKIEDTAKYVCHAKNYKGIDTTSAFVIVQKDSDVEHLEQ